MRRGRQAHSERGFLGALLASRDRRGAGIKRVVREIQRRQWRDILANDPEFRDLENPEDPDGPLSNAGQPSHLDRIDSGTVAATEAYYRRLGELVAKLPYHRDRKIGQAIADGKSMRDIKRSLRVGQSRIDRVRATMKRWLPESCWNDEEATA